MFAIHPQMQVKTPQIRLSARGGCFSHAEACRMHAQAMSIPQARRIVIDLSTSQDATTSAFAQLVLLRRTLLRTGRDLCVTNLHDRAAGVFEVNRLQAVLPVG